MSEKIKLPSISELTKLNHVTLPSLRPFSGVSLPPLGNTHRNLASSPLGIIGAGIGGGSAGKGLPVNTKAASIIPSNVGPASIGSMSAGAVSPASSNSSQTTPVLAPISHSHSSNYEYGSNYSYGPSSIHSSPLSVTQQTPIQPNYISIPLNYPTQNVIHDTLGAPGGVNYYYNSSYVYPYYYPENYIVPEVINKPINKCHRCGTTETPEWRKGPNGARTLCNACGLFHAKLVKRKGAVIAAKEVLNHRVCKGRNGRRIVIKN